MLHFASRTGWGGSFNISSTYSHLIQKLKCLHLFRRVTKLVHLLLTKQTAASHRQREMLGVGPGNIGRIPLARSIRDQCTWTITFPLRFLPLNVSCFPKTFKFIFRSNAKLKQPGYTAALMSMTQHFVIKPKTGQMTLWMELKTKPVLTTYFVENNVDTCRIYPGLEHYFRY